MENDGDNREIRRHSFLKYAARAALMTSFSVNLTIPNALVWARRWLSTEAPAFARFGIVRLVRVVLQISGFSKADPSGSITEIVLNRSALYADGTAKAFKELLKPQHVGIELSITDPTVFESAYS